LAAARLIWQHDLVHSNGASMRYFLLSKLLGKPFTWKHATYQTLCIDGFGWLDNAPAPMTPLASVRHHWTRRGWWYSSRKGIRLKVRRIIARLVDANIAISHHQANLLKFPRLH